MAHSNRLSLFNPLDCFTIHFEKILIWFLCVSGLQSKCSPVYPALARVIHWQTPGWNIWTRACLYQAITSCLLCHTYHQSLLSIGSQNTDYILHTNSSGGLVGRKFVTLKSIRGITGLCRGKLPLWLYVIILHSLIEY